MEKECFLSGYCRVLDGSRMVEVLVEEGRVTEVDCRYPDCLYAAACPIARQIEGIPGE